MVTVVVAASLAAGGRDRSFSSNVSACGFRVSSGLALLCVATGSTCCLAGSGGGVGLTDSFTGGGVGEVEEDMDTDVLDNGEGGGAGLADDLVCPGAGLADALLSELSSESNKRDRLR